MTATLGNGTHKKEKPEPAAEQRDGKAGATRVMGKPSGLAG